MTSFGNRPAPVMRLIEILGSLQDLQLLMLLMGDPTRWWDVATMSLESGNPVAITRQGLDRLASNNLLDIKVTNDVRYRYKPGTPELERAGAAFLDAYRRNPLEIALLVGKKGAPWAGAADVGRFRTPGGG